MKIISLFYFKVAVFLAMFFSLGSCTTSEQKSDNELNYELWYDSPAAIWEACVPLGNGKLGAMPDGGISKETITLNDITLWSGSPQDADNVEAYKYLPQIQELLLQNKNIEAQKLMDKYFKCQGEGSALGNGANAPYGTFQVLGTLNIQYDYKNLNVDSVKNYKRNLNLNNAIATTFFDIEDVHFNREYFTSFNNDVFITKLEADKKEYINVALSLNRPERYTVKAEGNKLIMFGELNSGTPDKEGMKYQTELEVVADEGIVKVENDTIYVNDANACIIYLVNNTDYKNLDYKSLNEKQLKDAKATTYAKELTKHKENYRKYFTTSMMNIGGKSLDSIPTDLRLNKFAEQNDDNGLINLYYQFGRYLLISSTRPGLLAPNLQGLWANTISTPWNGDYHLNINIQMNHWPLEITNLGELNEPFYTLVQDMVPNGEKTAKAYYNADGWVAHVITNLWQFTSPGEHYSWGSYNTGSAWICQTLWSHYEYSKDQYYLKQIYPILKGSSKFYLNTLIKEPTNEWLVTAPSNSPENGFYLPSGEIAHVCMGPTIDNQIIRYLFSKTLEAAETCDVDISFQESLKQAIKQLPPNQVGKDGRLMEWLEEYEEPEPHHRHISHLWGLYPGDEINTNTPEWMEAAEKSLIARGDYATGWSSAWKTNLWARLKNGDKALNLLSTLLYPVVDENKKAHNRAGSYPNLFCAHPPFQIDGNFGGTAGIAEMLLQSHEGYISVLPALPSLWDSGEFQGICTRDGGVVDLVWKNKKIESLKLSSKLDNTFKIKLDNQPTKIINPSHAPTNFSDGFLEVTLKKGESITLDFN